MPEHVLPIVVYIAGPYRDPRGAGYIRRNIAYSFAGRSIRWLRALCERAGISLKLEEQHLATEHLDRNAQH